MIIDFKKLVKLSKQRIDHDDLFFAPKPLNVPLNSSWCLMSYPNHPRGCPNWGKNDLCPHETNRKKIGTQPYE